ncbi:homeobox protein Hox-A13-like [Herpailurus yagouaroundi]|uniref:homeobox protein Hox-A13-like n=1 Tax=Herpailurus yagouaroundi TaxID=1608482 RepID=UPI001AD69C79|nr:homeobox protein Hox-A13-like [Puma yagouaroundi]
MSLGSAAAPAAAAAAAAAAGAEAAAPHRARRSRANSFLPPSAPPVHRAGRTPPRASGRAPSPRPLPAPDARGHLFAAPARDSPARGSPQRRPGGAGDLNSCAASSPGAAARAAWGGGWCIPNGSGGSPVRPRPRPRAHIGCGPAPSTLTSGCGLALTSEHSPAPGLVLTSVRGPASGLAPLLGWSVSQSLVGISFVEPQVVSKRTGDGLPRPSPDRDSWSRNLGLGPHQS